MLSLLFPNPCPPPASPPVSASVVDLLQEVNDFRAGLALAEMLLAAQPESQREDMQRTVDICRGMVEEAEARAIGARAAGPGCVAVKLAAALDNGDWRFVQSAQFDLRAMGAAAARRAARDVRQ